jgi:response regulator RpfG family c-di-GMP phosphodiesterase
MLDLKADPGHVGSVPTVTRSKRAMVTDRILFVDDDPEMLEVYEGAFGARHTLETADGPERGWEMVKTRGPYAVVVSDYQMPKIDGIEFLAGVRGLNPDTVRVIVTGVGDLKVAMAAVNEGKVFCFLTKPCDLILLGRALAMGIEQYRLVHVERELLEQTLNRSIKVLTDVLAMVSPAAFGRASRIARVVRQLAEQLGVENIWEMEIAAMLSQLGCVALPEAVLEKVYVSGYLTPAEAALVAEHARIGHDLIASIPRLEVVAKIVKYQTARWNGFRAPDGVSGEAIPLGARVLKIALDFDTLTHAGATPQAAAVELSTRGGWYDAVVLQALKRLLARHAIEYEATAMSPAALEDGMILAEDVFSAAGVLLVPKGQEVTPSLRLRLQHIAERTGFKRPIQALVVAPRALDQGERHP